MRVTKILIAVLLLFLSFIYLILYVVNSGGNFTISLDKKMQANDGIIMSDSANFKNKYTIMKAPAIENMDNITESWLPNNLHEHSGGVHNGDNYIAITFYIKNTGDNSIDYTREIKIDSVINDIDEAIRVAVYYNDDYKVYAKWAQNGSNEPNSVKFSSNHRVFKNTRKKFKPGEMDKYTVVIWLEGEDPQCIDDILGGEMKMSMFITKVDED